jgi:hypothetical protein
MRLRSMIFTLAMRFLPRRFQGSRGSAEYLRTVAARQQPARRPPVTRRAEFRRRPVTAQFAKLSTSLRNILPAAPSTKAFMKTSSRPAIGPSMKRLIAKRAIPSVAR